MPGKQRYNLSEADRQTLREDHRLIRTVTGRMPVPRGRWFGTPGGGGGGHRIGVLDGALAAPAGITGTPTTATVSRYRRNTSTGLLEDTGEDDLITNHDPSLSGGAGALVKYRRLQDIWDPIYVGCTEQNEVQRVAITGSPTGGTFPLTLDGETAADLAYNIDAATLQSSLAALSSIGADNVSCSGGPLPGTPIDVTFTGALQRTDVDLMTTHSDDLTGGTDPAVTVTETTKGCCG